MINFEFKLESKLTILAKYNYRRFYQHGLVASGADGSNWTLEQNRIEC